MANPTTGSTRSSGSIARPPYKSCMRACGGHINRTGFTCYWRWNAVFADILRWLCALLLKRVGRDFVDGFRILMEGNCEEAEKGKEI